MLSYFIVGLYYLLSLLYVNTVVTKHRHAARYQFHFSHAPFVLDQATQYYGRGSTRFADATLKPYNGWEGSAVSIQNIFN